MGTLFPVGHDGEPTNATELVLAGWATSTQYANSTFNTSLSFLNNIADISNSLSDLPSINEELGELTTNVSQFIKPVKPDDIDITPNFPTIETEVELTDVAAFEIPDEPTFNVVAPDSKTLVSPSPFNEDAPITPLLATREYPDAPEESIPTIPTLRELTLPDAPDQIDIVFDAKLPSVLEAAPSVDFTFTEQEYNTELLDKLNERLLSFISGFSTGLDPAVEQQIWDRHRRRVSVSTRKLKSSSERYFAASGWSVPGGDLLNKNFEAEQESLNQDAEASKDIMIAQAELEQKNLQFSFGMAAQIEQTLTTLANSVQQRKFEAAKYSIQAAIELYGLKVSEFNANIEAYIAQSKVYAERIRAELSKVELFKAELDGQKLISEINQQDIDIYRETINSVLALYELYKTKLEAVKTQIGGDELVIKQFESEINAFESKIRAKSLQYDNFKIENDVELTKNEIYKSRTSAYKEQVDALNSIANIRKIKQDSDIKIGQEIPLEVFKEKSQSARILVQAESERLKALTDVLKTKTEVFNIETEAEKSKVESEVSIRDQDLKELIAKSDIRIESLKGSLTAAISKQELLIQAAIAGGQISSNLAAASLSTVNLSSSISESDSESNSTSASVSSSISTIIQG